MTITRTPFSQFPMLAKMDLAYAQLDASLAPFYTYTPDIESFKQVILDKKKDKTDRKTLVSTLKRQYLAQNPKNMEYSDIPNPFGTEAPLFKQINLLLDENTFTVTTAHQPSLMTGPLYFIYKIFSTINLARQLKTHYPDYNFVPVFVIGGEDHDFEEVNTINIFNKKITWENEEQGAVGMMQTASLLSVLSELKNVLGESENAQTIFNIINKNYTQNAVYQDATQGLLIDLFGKYGLVVLNMNDAELKKLFIPVMKKEISEQVSKPLVEKAQRALNDLGFKSQAFPREINLFYLRENLRERIVFEDGVYKVLNTNYQWDSLENFLAEVEEAPQYFSPNVVMRPLYQELVLPNLAYIGGGGELAYWLERKEQFATFGINFPMLIRRNSVMWIDKGSNDKLTKLNLDWQTLTIDTEQVIKDFLGKNAADPLSMEAEKTEIRTLFQTVLGKAKAVDPTLEKSVLAEEAKAIQSIEIIESKLMKAEKQKNETTLNQIRLLAQKFFPNGGLQERTDNFLPYYLKQGDGFFDVLNEHLNPLVEGFVVIEE
jgi:bacillithiol synthase